MLAADMVRGEASAPLSTLLAAEQRISLMMLVWDRQQGVQKIPSAIALDRYPMSRI